MSERVCWVGVTGHRTLDGADEGLLRTHVRALLGAIAGRSEAGVVSPLAEGADRLVAEEGLALGLPLRVVLPLPLADYRTDFATHASRAQFDALLARAALEDPAPEDPVDRPAAYAEVGRRLVMLSTALLAIWDGEPARGTGGTAEIIDLALRQGVPIAWIGAARPHHVRFVLPGSAWREVPEGDFLTAVLTR